MVVAPVDSSFSKLIRPVLADLQSRAWDLGLKMIVSVTSDFIAQFDHERAKTVITDTARELMDAMSPGSVLTLTIGIDPHPPDPKRGRCLVEITTPPVDKEVLASVIAKGCNESSEGIVWSTRLTPSFAAVSIGFLYARLASGAIPTRTALVVDDDLDTQEFLGALLISHGLRVIPVSDAVDALTVIARHEPNVVLTDIVMPNMTGLDLVSRIKETTPHLPVVIFSGYRESLLRQGKELPDRVLAKPLSSEDVMSAINSVL